MTNIRFEPHGVIPACLMPFDANLEIDEPAYRRHLRDLAGVKDISAITVNGHAAEVHALSFDEQQRALEIARDEVGAALPLVAGVYTANTREARRIAQMAAKAGADGLLVFPSDALALGGQRRPESALAHVAAIAEATELPLILFQYPLAGGLGYPLDTLLRLCSEFPTIKAIKDWCNDPALHERHIRELRALDRPVKVLSTHSAWLLPSLVLGCDGLLSGAGSVIANLHVALWQAVRAHDLKLAQEIKDAPRKFEEASTDFRFAAAVAQFGLLLRDSQYKGAASYDEVIRTAGNARGNDPHGHRTAFVALVETARQLATGLRPEK